MKNLHKIHLYERFRFSSGARCLPWKLRSSFVRYMYRPDNIVLMRTTPPACGETSSTHPPSNRLLGASQGTRQELLDATGTAGDKSQHVEEMRERGSRGIGVAYYVDICRWCTDGRGASLTCVVSRSIYNLPLM